MFGGVVELLFVIAAGVLAISGLIISKNPNAKQVFDKIIPFQGIAGLVLLVLGIINLIRSLEYLRFVFQSFVGLMGFTVIVSEILLGLIFGFALLAKLIPGEGAAEKKGADIVKKLMPLQVPIGIVAIVSAFIVLIRVG